MSELLTVKSLLARANVHLVDLRRALGHRHDDEPWWQERAQTVREAQRGRRFWRDIANLLHTERANSRGRIHGAFVTLDDQRAWMARKETWTLRLAGVPAEITLASLRTGVAIEAAA